MKAGDIMTAGAATVRIDATVAHAARTMLEHRVSGLPVVDAAGKLAGIVTERDLLRRAEIGTEKHRPGWVELWLSPQASADEYVRARTRKVSDVMSTDVVTVGPETPLDEVISLMERKGFKRLPVVREGKIVGIISRANFLVALSHRIEENTAGPADDLAIRRSILGEIEAQRWNPLAMVDVDVKNGEVHLRGSVSDEPVRRAVVVAAENTRGVTKVTDNLSVVPFVSAGI
ncbi:CBS domain-containing protein [Aquibium sp. LZ166]|uniref:CBS domain-containing protein n=1 Tax=Aquibium pacificus TaxID=3153579 RepID=A0ABV3SIX3_9HYPH